MFDSSFAVGNPTKKSTCGEYGENGHVIYKVRTSKKKPYMVRIDEFHGDIFFIKFYPKNLESSPRKYKNRVGDVNELYRLIGTCIKISKQILEKEPDACIGFHGQWDETDVETKTEVSQRFKIYQRAVMSLADKENFDFIYEDQINTMILVPKHISTPKQINKITSVLGKVFKHRLREFRIPTAEELKIYHSN